MREFIINNAQAVVLGCAAVELLTGIAVILFKGRRKTNMPVRICLVLICISLFYDATIIAVGKYLGDGELLRYLSIPRYLLAAVMTPLLFPICAYAVDAEKNGLRLTWIFTVLLMAAGIVHTLMTVLTPVEFAGLLRYAAGSETPVWAIWLAIGINAICILPLIISGARLIPRKHNIAILLAGISMLGATMIAPATGNTDLTVFLSMIGEALMVFFIFLYAQTAQEAD